MGETWGISGPAFLLFYVVLAVVVLIASIRARRAVTRAGGTEPVTAIRTRPHDVAYLNGGAELALVSALTALRLRGSIWSERGNAQAVPRSDAGHDELERAVHAAVATPTTASGSRTTTASPTRSRRRAAAGRRGPAALRRPAAPDPRHRLVDARRGRAGAAAAARGHRERAAGDLAGRGVHRRHDRGGDPVGLGPAAHAARGPDPRGPARRQPHLAPKERPDWALYGPVGAALGIGLFGMSAVWASDPAIAGELAVQRMNAGPAAGRGELLGRGLGWLVVRERQQLRGWRLRRRWRMRWLTWTVAHARSARRLGGTGAREPGGVGEGSRRTVGEPAAWGAPRATDAHAAPTWRSGASVRGTDAPGRRFAVDGVGAGWRPEIAGWVATAPGLGFCEIIAESVAPAGPHRGVVDLQERGVPVIPHGIRLSLGGAEPLDPSRVGSSRPAPKRSTRRWSASTSRSCGRRDGRSGTCSPCRARARRSTCWPRTSPSCRPS